jgi:REP element-mobilizing transposase RayT
VLDRYRWLCFAYCLMGNHYHLVVETQLPNLPLGMRQLNGRYAQRFNARHDRCGHVFQARYRSILVESNSYLPSVCRYVVLNPVRHGLCDHPADWPWSSYHATAGTGRAHVPLALGPLLGVFAPTTRAAQQRYRDFVGAGIGDALGDRVRGERLGEDDFLRDTFGHDDPIPEVPREQWLQQRPALPELFEREELPLAVAYRRYGYTLREIADYLGCHYATVSRALAREELEICRNARPDPGL